MGILGSTSSSVFIVGPGGALGSRSPAGANGEKASSPANAKTRIANIFVVFIFLPFPKKRDFHLIHTVHPVRTGSSS
jgi:hypothetical protein